MSAKSYSLHPDFRRLSFVHFPADISVLPVCNALLSKIIDNERSSGLVRVRKKEINGYRGTRVKLLIYEPFDLPNDAPCLVYYHGGGFMLKAAPFHYKLMRAYAVSAQCKVIFVDYSLTPDVIFPTPAEECYKAYIWTVKNAANLNIDRRRIAVGGDSAGGNLAAAVTLMAKDRHAPMPCFQMLIYPLLDSRMGTASMKKHYDTPVFDSMLAHLVWRLYTPVSPKNPSYASPALAETLEGLPQAYIETAEFDCLHDEDIAYAERLKRDGVNVTLYNTSGTPHGFDAVSDSRITKKSIKIRVIQLKTAFKLHSERNKNERQNRN